MKDINTFLNEASVDQTTVRELLLQAWNTKEIVDVIEGTIKSMLKKDPSTISVDHLAKSSVMTKICTMAIKAEDPHWRVDSATRKEFYQQLAQEMVDRMDEFK